ncbi:hypothetical protein [Flaviaesturariibacter terrae]
MENSNNPNDLFPEPPQEKLGIPLTIVSFCIPLVGIILFFVNKDKNRQKANTACYAAIAGAVFGIIVRLITMSTMGTRGY